MVALDLSKTSTPKNNAPMCEIIENRLSDTGVPRVVGFCSRGAQALAEPFQAIGYGEAGDVFDVLVAELPGNTQSKRSAEWDGKLAAIHAVREESLRVQCIG